MRTKPPVLAPFFRSDAQGRILAAILLSPEREQPMSVVARSAGVPLTTVLREVDRLEEAGVLVSRKLGQVRLVSVDQAYPLLAPLTQIVAATFGPLPLVSEAFADLAGIEELVVFGSWAARAAGVPGRFPGDVDLLVVGQVDRLDAVERAIDAGERIGREVNVTVVPAERWQAGTDGFIADIRAKPFLEIGAGTHE
jgi:DNA-binding Lrp family transcriptional regulator